MNEIEHGYQRYSGKLQSIYKSQGVDSMRHVGIPPSYSYTEFSMWCGDNGYDEVYKAWAMCGYDRQLAPAIDKIDTESPYSLDNITVVEWGRSVRNRLLMERTSVLRYKDGLCTEYKSIEEASGDKRGSLTDIIKACTSSNPDINGYRWVFTGVAT